MSQPQGGVTTFVQNPGTSNESVTSQIAVPLSRLRLTGQAQLPEVIRQVNLLEEAINQATLGPRSLPFSGPISYLVDYSFPANQQVRISHRLGTDRVRVWIGHQSDFGSVQVVSVTNLLATLQANAAFTADIMFLVIP